MVIFVMAMVDGVVVKVAGKTHREICRRMMAVVRFLDPHEPGITKLPFPLRFNAIWATDHEGAITR